MEIIDAQWAMWLGNDFDTTFCGIGGVKKLKQANCVKNDKQKYRNAKTSIDYCADLKRSSLFNRASWSIAKRTCL